MKNKYNLFRIAMTIILILVIFSLSYFKITYFEGKLVPWRIFSAIELIAAMSIYYVITKIIWPKKKEFKTDKLTLPRLINPNYEQMKYNHTNK